MFSKRSCAFVMACFVLCAGADGAQAPASSGHSETPQSPQLVPRTPQQREETYESQRRISLHVVVADASGKAISGLKPDDFTVLDQGQSRKIARFEEVKGSLVADSEVHGLVVLDAINGGSGGVNRVRKELVKWLRQSQGPLGYPLEIVVVSEAGTNEDKPTTDRSTLTNDLSRLTRNVHSTDCYASQPGSDIQGSRIGAEFMGQDAAYARWSCLNSHFMDSLNALKMLAQEQESRKGPAIVVWTGSGWPLPPRMGTGQIMGGGTMGDLSDATFSIEMDMQQAQITLHAVSSGRFERAQGVRRTGLQGNLKGASLQEQEAALELPSLAEQTGGLALEKSKSLADALNSSLADGEEFYSFAFDPPPAKTQDQWHSIEVKVDRSGATVRTLTGYYAQP